MQTLGPMRAHFWRVIKMAKATQVDLSTALDENKITSSDYADMVTRCRGCAQVGQCDRLLAKMPMLETAPAYCENREVFHDLQNS